MKVRVAAITENRNDDKAQGHVGKNLKLNQAENLLLETLDHKALVGQHVNWLDSWVRMQLVKRWRGGSRSSAAKQ